MSKTTSEKADVSGIGPNMNDVSLKKQSLWTTIPPYTCVKSSVTGGYPMFASEQEALSFIDNNQKLLLLELSELGEMEMKTIYENENTSINIMREGKNLLKFINRYASRDIVDIFKEMIDFKLIG